MNDITLNSALEDYYTIRLTSGRITESTRRAHEQRLELMRTWITRRTQPDVYLRDIDDRLMSDYFRTLKPPRYADSSYNNFRQYCRGFYGFCTDEGWMRTDPMRHIDPLTVPEKQHLILTADEMMQALDGAAPRDRIALAVGMNSLLRAHDVTALLVGSAALDSGLLAVNIQKTRKVDQLPIPLELRDELFRWFDHYAETMGLADARLIPNHWHLIPPIQFLSANVWDPASGGTRRYCPERRLRHPEVIVHRALEQLGHPTKGQGFHTLRRSAGRALHDVALADGDGEAIRIVQALYGHKRQATTEGYLGLTVEKQARDKLLRGKSFLGRAAELNRERIAGDGLRVVGE